MDSNFFQSWKKTESKKCKDSFFSFLFFFLTTFPPISGTLFFFSELKCSDFSLSYFLLCMEPGFRLWLPDMLWHYSLHQLKLFKDFDPKKSHIECTHFSFYLLKKQIAPLRWNSTTRQNHTFWDWLGYNPLSKTRKVERFKTYFGRVWVLNLIKK